MFNALKKKLFSWIKPEEEKAKKKPAKAEKPKKSEKKIAKASKTAKISKKKTQTKEKLSASIPQKAKQTSTQIAEPKIQLEKQDLETSKEEILEVEDKNLENEQPIEQEIEGPEEKQGFFKRLITKISKSQLTMDQFEEIFMELELTLLENNVAIDTVDKIKGNLSGHLVGQHLKKEEAEPKILQALKDSILDVLIEPPNLIEKIRSSKKPYTILFFGINGSGKTTSIAKLASLLKKNNISCVLAAGDTFRAASIEQLKTHAENLKLPIVAQQYGSDPAAVAFDAISHANKHNTKAVLIDTAGRMYTKQNLLKEMEKIVRISKPDLKIFVGESITGNDALEQARTFNEIIGVDGIILSKADMDEKAGTILSVSHVTKKPIYFLGTGQEYSDLEVFTKDSVLEHLGLK